MNKALMDKDMSMDMLNSKLSIDSNMSIRRQMTENQKCRVEQTWQQSQNSLTLIGSLKTETCQI